MRRFARRAFYRRRGVREMVAGARWLFGRIEPPDVAHLTLSHDNMDGPVQRDEALLLHALLRVLRPKTVVEIGFFRGQSAFNFLRALDGEARLYSFDIKPACLNVAERRFGRDPRFRLVLKSHEKIEPKDI